MGSKRKSRRSGLRQKRKTQGGGKFGNFMSYFRRKDDKPKVKEPIIIPNPNGSFNVYGNIRNMGQNEISDEKFNKLSRSEQDRWMITGHGKKLPDGKVIKYYIPNKAWGNIISNNVDEIPGETWAKLPPREMALWKPTMKFNILANGLHRSRYTRKNKVAKVPVNNLNLGSENNLELG